MITLNYRDARPIYEQVCDGLRRLIVSGAIADGDKLPSVRALATQLAINPNTIQRAYRRLEAEGWIATVPGKGCFVCGDGEIREREKKRLLTVSSRLTVTVRSSFEMTALPIWPSISVPVTKSLMYG